MRNACRKVSHGTNTSNVRSVSKGVETALRMEAGLVTKEESEARVREAVARAEEEIYGCPLLQKAMARVEAEALGLATSPEKEKAVPEEKVEGRDFGCQVGDEEHLRPFVISVGLQCKLDETAPLVLEKDKTELSRPVDPARERVVRSVGVGDCKVIYVIKVAQVQFRFGDPQTPSWLLSESEFFVALVLNIVFL